MKVYLIVEAYSNGVETWHTTLDVGFKDKIDAEIKATELNEDVFTQNTAASYTEYYVKEIEIK